MKIRQVLDEVLESIQPDREYEKDIFEKLNVIIKNVNKGQKRIKAILGGSGAKGTWLRTFDADIFVLFDYKKYKDKSDRLPDILERILRKKFRKIIRLHGSRDYFQIKQGDFTFEIVPILRIQKAEQAKNITDVSPLHSKWVLKHKKKINEIKLTKQFCQANNVYGAESYIRGFSGYVCEILAVYYGSFLNLARNAAKWDSKVVIDAGRYYRGKDVFKLVNTSKLVSPLVVIDPVQKDRNAAAALSIGKFDVFKNAAKKFLKNPSKEFFARKNMDMAFLKEKSGGNILIRAKATPLGGKIDVVGGKLLKIYEFLVAGLKKHGFSMIRSDWEWDKKNDSIMYFLLDKKPLSRTVQIEGPPIKIKQHAEHFRKIHKKTFAKNGKIFAIGQREFVKPEDLMKKLVKDEFVRERCSSIRLEVV
ncbi:CCA tRNA nucleotidyltransferase [Candidatus Woesearchaeota archaeon]|nr:CCA tRNA nucleotidyltransferase [Candidatus Woesearchaeota archaeon]